jgi:CTP synthase
VVDKLGLDLPEADLSDWKDVCNAMEFPESEVTIAMVGKYIDLTESYKSLNEALTHAGIQTQTHVNIEYIDAEKLESEGLGALSHVDAILVPGGFGKRGTEGKIASAGYARRNKIPYLGICLGMQVAVIDYARNCANLTEAHSTEFNTETPHPVIGLITEWQAKDGSIEKRTKKSKKGGTMRLGGQTCQLKPNSLAKKMYEDKKEIVERHRHRYEFNNAYKAQLEEAGLSFSGLSSDGSLVEMLEIEDHPWFLACQFHPEFTSRPRTGHSLFTGYIEAALKYKQTRQQ